jgi:hypothetical protein
MAGLCSHEQVSCFRTKRKGLEVTIIEIRPFRNGWKVFEAPGVEPVFAKDEAIDYAQNRLLA